MTIRMIALSDLEERGELCCLCTRGFVKAVVAVERTSEDGIALYGLCGNHAEVFTEEDLIKEPEIEDAVKDVHRFSHFISPEIEIERDANGSFTVRH